MPTESKQTETSEDTVIQTIQMGCSKRIARRFTTHSLNMERLLATSFQQQQIHLETAHCRRQSCDFLLVLYKKNTSQSGNQAQTVVQKHKTEKPFQRMCSFHIAELLSRLWFLETSCWFVCSERFLHYTSLPLLHPTPVKNHQMKIT